MVRICGLLAFIPIVLSCCIPNQWEGNLGIKFAVVDYGQLSAGWEFYNISFDAVNKKIAMVGHIGFEHSEWYEHILQDFATGKQYADKAGTCHVTPLPGSLVNCIPSNATIVRSSYFGIGLDKLNVNFYEFIPVNGKSTAEISVLKDGCVPVTEFMNYNGTIMELHYLDIIPGIRSEKVFDVPPACQNVAQISNKQQYLLRPRGFFFQY